MTKKQKIGQWTDEISARSNLFDLQLKEIWRYRDLLVLLVKRDYITIYKQTLLGPIWFLLQPALTVIIYVIVFRNIAGISTDGLPPILFYLAGIIVWNYFSECFSRVATVFKDNAEIWSKVYFPRLIVPLSIVVSSLIKLGIQIFLFVIVLLYFFYRADGSLQINTGAVLFPLLLIIVALLAMGGGLIFAALTRKYRDLFFVLGFGLQLAMYATPIIYPLSSIGTNYQWLLSMNPMTSVVEAFRYGFLGSGSFLPETLFYSFAFGLLLFLVGVFYFNKAGRTFVDTF